MHTYLATSTSLFCKKLAGPIYRLNKILFKYLKTEDQLLTYQQWHHWTLQIIVSNMKRIIHIKACTRYIHSLNKNKFSSLWSCGLSWYRKDPMHVTLGSAEVSDSAAPVEPGSTDSWSVGFHCSAIQCYCVFFVSFSFTEIELTCTAEWIDLHRPWNGYHSKFSERPSSPYRYKKGEGNKLFLCDENSNIYSADNCQI